MESMIMTSPYFSSLGYDNSSGSSGGGYLEDVLQQLNCIPNSYTNLLLYHPAAESSSIRSRSRSGDDDQESMIFPTTEQFNDINTKYTYDQVNKSSLFSITCQENNNEERMKKKTRSTKRRRLVYHPFALVKPGGEEGDVTLNDINTRMLMPPTRPIHHPVGRFASRPNPHRPVKPILALTTIRTLGTGTLTIIRTKT